MDSSLDLGLFIVRLALGPMLFVHGYNKVFGAGGLAGTTRWFEGLGLKPAWLHARIAPVNELGAGILITVGLLTPLACAAYVGLMTVAGRTDHRNKGYFMFKNGWEYVLLVAVVALGLAATGPGDWSLDHAFGLDWNGWAWALVAAVLGVGFALVLLAVSFRPEKENAEPAVAA